MYTGSGVPSEAPAASFADSKPMARKFCSVTSCDSVDSDLPATSPAWRTSTAEDWVMVCAPAVPIIAQTRSRIGSFMARSYSLVTL